MLDTSRYLTDKSDIVALLVLEHQVSVHNLIIHANYKSRALLAKEWPAAATASDTPVHWLDLPAQVRLRLAAMVKPLVRGMVMADMARLPRPISGTSGYAAQFGTRGPRDSNGRSFGTSSLKPVFSVTR
jgi:hypothetical protein